MKYFELCSFIAPFISCSFITTRSYPSSSNNVVKKFMANFETTDQDNIDGHRSLSDSHKKHTRWMEKGPMVSIMM